MSQVEPGLRINLSGSNVSVALYKDRLQAVIEANLIGDCIWWIARALVQPAEYRGQGIGTALLRTVQQTVDLAWCKQLQVIPGGYERNTQKQYNFYLKNGFVRSIDAPEMLIWRPSVERRNWRTV